MFGYVINEIFDLMLVLIQYSYVILCCLVEVCKNGIELVLGFDVKLQLLVCYENGKLVGVILIVLLIQYLDEVLIFVDVCVIVEFYIIEVLFEGWIFGDIEWWINLIGKFVIGGLDGDVGLMGCKIIVDIYGGVVLYGGGVFLGKDLIKVDCLVVYVVCYLVKNVVVVGLVDKCIIQLLYVIGVVKLLLIYVNIYGINIVDEVVIECVVVGVMDFMLCGICMYLGLNKLIYVCMVVYGYFGCVFEVDGGFVWECMDFVDVLKLVI